MKIIILAGGGGSRLFPLSRGNYPKQFLSIAGDTSLLIRTVQRFKNLVSEQDIVVVTGEQHHKHVDAQLLQNHLDKVNLLSEPMGKNTAPAILLAAKYCEEQLGSSPEEVMFVAASDHILEPQWAFEKSVNAAMLVAQKEEKLVVFGIKPTEPHSGYGYIKIDWQEQGEYSLVREFCEKPDIEIARAYCAQGNYYWNSGMFAFRIDTFYAELKEHAPRLFELGSGSLDELLRDFELLPSISIDYAIAEHSQRAVMFKLPCAWSDVGSWDAVWDVLPKDNMGNVQRGECIALDCKDSLLWSEHRLIAGIGLEDVLAIEADDVVVLARRGDSQKVKELMETLKKSKHKDLENSSLVARIWGTYKIIERGEGYKVKQIIVNPGASLSMQMHYHRSEHWVVTAGTALVYNSDKEFLLENNQSTFIPVGVRHQLSNPGKIPLKIIEIQSGDYLEEDDIVRFN